jgi:multiple sugar transport system substrate-binding protein
MHLSGMMKSIYPTSAVKRTMFFIFVALAGLFVLPTSSQAKTTLQFWHFWTDPEIRPFIDTLVTEFETANPEIDVEITDLTWANGQEKIALALASGQGPDVVELGSDWIAQFAMPGQLSDISARIRPDSAGYVGWGLSTWKEKVHAMPWVLGTRVLFVNRSILNASKLDSNFLPYNWNYAQYANVKVRYDGKPFYPWGSNTPEKHRLYKKVLPFFWSFGADFFDKTGKFSTVASDRAIAALDLYKQFHDSGALVGDQRTLEDAFVQGKLAMLISGDWLLKRLSKTENNFEYFTLIMPGIAYPSFSFLGGEYLAIPEKSSNKDAAWQFIRFVSSPENQLRFSKVSGTSGPSARAIHRDPYFESDMNRQTMVKQLMLVKSPPVDPRWPAIEREFETAIEQVLFNGVRPADALYELRNKIEALPKPK